MTRDDRFYAFIVARTSRSRAHIRRLCVHKRWLRASAVGLFVVLCGLMYGFYGLTQQAEHLRVERENHRLRQEYDRQRQALQSLNNRVTRLKTRRANWPKCRVSTKMPPRHMDRVGRPAPLPAPQL